MRSTLKETLSGVVSLAPAAYTSDADGAGVDLQGYDGGALVVLAVGDWTDGTHAVAVEESDDDSTYTAVAADDLDGSFSALDAAGDDSTVQLVGYLGSSRYVRVSVLVTGSPATGAVYGAAVLRSAKYQPA
jgi:hypothetical protein